MTYEPIPLATKARILRVTLDLYSALMCAHQAPRGRRMFERMRRPQPGDWVVEESMGHRLLDWYDDPTVTPRLTSEQNSVESLWCGQVTPFLRESTEWHPWYEDTFNPDYPYYRPGAPLDGYWEHYRIVENPDGTEYRWVNCSLIVCPMDQSIVPPIDDMLDVRRFLNDTGFELRA